MAVPNGKGINRQVANFEPAPSVGNSTEEENQSRLVKINGKSDYKAVTLDLDGMITGGKDQGLFSFRSDKHTFEGPEPK